ncbi:MAG: pyrroline-5-carboxylate reductase [Candidatus Syntrophonatronum acetioxidans]|uniref:Pyrroline-5-carboxylate reductase n=1 Tax=Candidatus Syntrophonatronum acetioxidans TaxID=1795816 RepID=A0A424YI10_9FIRM|nr:MAG: pyrroline-5-carboxylate reductase [Candidatus Syntrophonatronum acetioxidans]
MSDCGIGFIGCGVMGSAMVKGFLKNEKVSPQDIIVFDAKEREIVELKEVLGVKTALKSGEVFKTARTIFIAVKPQDMPEVLKRIKNDVSEEHLVVSIAAGISISEIKRELGHDRKVVRVMPNTPCLTGSGMSCIAAGEGVESEEVNYIKDLLESLGKAVIMEEKYMDAATALSGSGPAFVLTFIEALVDGGIKSGLPRETALLLATQTVLGTADMVESTNDHPSLLKEQVKSPGGTTIFGLHALENASFRGAVINAVESSCQRSKELGKERHEKGKDR